MDEEKVIIFWNSNTKCICGITSYDPDVYYIYNGLRKKFNDKFFKHYNSYCIIEGYKGVKNGINKIRFNVKYVPLHDSQKQYIFSEERNIEDIKKVIMGSFGITKLNYIRLITLL